VRIFTRYILREVVSHALLGGLLFTFVLFIPNLKLILELVVRDSASLRDVILVVLYMLPVTLMVTIPMAVLVGVLLGLSRLASDSEVTAMRACGMGIFAFVRIVLIVAVAGWGLGMLNTLYITPRTETALLQMENSLKGTQATYAVQTGVFYEDFKNYVLYVQDVHPSTGAATWRHVFLADLSDSVSPAVTTAKEALAANGADQTLRLHLRDGTQHEISTSGYNLSTFTTMDRTLEAGEQTETRLSRSDTPMHAMSLRELTHAAHSNSNRLALIELNQRLSYPAACLALMLVGVPLGLSSKRGGKSTGFVLCILFVFLYYILSFVGLSLARQEKLPVLLGMWGANMIFAVAGMLLLMQMSRGGIALNAVANIGLALNKVAGSLTRQGTQTDYAPRFANTVQKLRRSLRSRFPLILDDYVMREFLRNFALVLLSFTALFLIFTFFELVGDIVRNRTPLVTVGDYLINLIPYILYNMTPFCSLVAVLVTFGSLQRSSEIIAIKATGISLYRVVTPVLLVAALLSVGLFAFDELELPAANRRQDELRSEIKGKPPQTFSRPDQKWMSGQIASNGEPSRIFYYQAFAQDQNVFANLTVFEFQPETFELERRIFAQSARWDDKADAWIFENGWVRTFAGDAVSSYEPFKLNTFPEIHEQPGYFTKEYRPSQEMSYGELSRYIADLKQGGTIPTTPYVVQLNKKLAYPLITLVMAVLAVPFSLSMGRRGGLTGISAAIGLAIAYWVTAQLFENLGSVDSLPPLLAAWSPDLLFGLAAGYLLLRTPT